MRDYVELHFDGTILRSLSDPVVGTPAGRSCCTEATRCASCSVMSSRRRPSSLTVLRSALTRAVVEIPKASHCAGRAIAHLVASRGGRLDVASTMTSPAFAIDGPDREVFESFRDG